MFVSALSLLPQMLYSFFLSFSSTFRPKFALSSAPCKHGFTRAMDLKLHDHVHCAFQQFFEIRPKMEKFHYHFHNLTAQAGPLSHRVSGSLRAPQRAPQYAEKVSSRT